MNNKKDTYIKAYGKFSKDDVRAFYRFLDHPPGTFTEIRGIHPRSGEVEQYFVINEDQFVYICRRLNEKYNVYAGINPRKKRRGDAESIDLITVIPVDIDSIHPVDEAATEEEVKQAKDVAIKIKEWLEEKAKIKIGFNFSGNGYHLLVPVHYKLKSEEKKKDWQRKNSEFYNLLKQNFEKDGCSIDSIGDPPRIIKVPGTKSIKGTGSDERPHRYAHVIELERREESSAIIGFINKLSHVEPHVELREAEVESVSWGRTRPCFEKAEREKLIVREGFRFPWACELVANGRSNQEIHKALKHYPGYDFDLTEYQIERIRRTGSKPYKCITIAKNYPSICYDGCPFRGKLRKTEESKEEERKTEERKEERKSKKRKEEAKDERNIEECPYYYDNSKIYFEILTTSEEYKFAYLGDEGRVELTESIEINNEKIIVPRRLPEREGRILKIVEMPNEELTSTPLREAGELYAKIEEHFKKYIDLPPLDLSLCAYYALFTWLYPKVNTLAYLRFLADTGKGKSRMLKVVSDLCFYPVSIMGAGSFSGAMRTNEKWHGTIVMDEADFKGEKEDNILKYLDLGFEKDKYFPLSDKQDPKMQEWFDPFSPKIIAMREPFGDNATEGRLLSISPRETTNPDIPPLLDREYEREASELRNLIARFVLEYWGRVDGEKLKDFKDMQLEPRLRQLSMPLTVISQVWYDFEPLFREYIAERQKEIKKIRSLSWEGSLFNFVYGVASGDEDLGEGFSGYTQEGSLQAVIPSMVAKKFNTTAKNATKTLRSIGFEIEHRYITYTIERRDSNFSEEKRKTVRAYIVPDKQTWREMIQRYYYSEEGHTNIDIPAILKSSKFSFKFGTWDTWDTS